MKFDPRTFGIGFHRFVQVEFETIGTGLAPLLHIATVVILFLVLRYGNKYRKLFTVYFALNWLFLLGYWGVYGSIYWSEVGTAYLLNFMAVPILLSLIMINFIRELLNPKLDLDFGNVKKPRYLALLVLLWGFWYPAYIYSYGFLFTAKDLLFSYYGLMPCPTTMVVLSLLTLNYPKGNRTLFNLMTAYAIFIGTAIVASGWIPDIPFIILGIYSFALIILNKISTRLSKKGYQGTSS